MPTPVRSGELTNAVRTLVGYVDDLKRIGFDDCQTKLRLVVNYCQKDATVRPLSEQLRARMPTEELHERVSGDALRLPDDPRDRLAFVHTLLYHIKQGWKLELRELLTRAVQGAGMEGRWRAFQQQVIGEYAAGLERVLRWLEQHPREGQVDAEEAYAEALASMAGPTAGAVAPAPAPAAPAPSPAADMPPAAPDLLAAIDAAGLPADEAHDLRLDAQLLAIELRKTRPSPARLAELERTFLAASEALATALHGVLGGEAAYVERHGGASIRDADARVAGKKAVKRPSGKTAAAKAPAKKKSSAKAPAKKTGKVSKKKG